MAQRVFLYLFTNGALLIAGFNFYWALRGLFTGAVPSLHKFSMASIHWSTEPLMFTITLVLHAAVGIVFAGWALVVVRDEIER